MEFFELLKKRQSIRGFKKKPVEEEKLRKILETANSSPSAGNLQAYEIIVIKSEEKKEELVEAAFGQKFVAEAPLVLVVCANENRSSRRYGERGKELYCINDASIAATYIQLAVADLGLGSVWVGAFSEHEVGKIINAPDYLRPIAILPIGYPDKKPNRTPRRDLDDLVHEEEF